MGSFIFIATLVVMAVLVVSEFDDFFIGVSYIEPYVA